MLLPLAMVAKFTEKNNIRDLTVSMHGDVLQRHTEV